MDKSATPEAEDVTELLGSVKEYPVVNVTVFTDRAEVTRVIKSKPSKGAGAYSLLVKGLVEAADPESIRVKAESAKCEILEVTFGIHHETKPKEEPAEVLECQSVVDKCQELAYQKASELKRVEQRDEMVQGYMAKELTNKDKATSTKVDTVRELLAFHEEHSATTDKKQIVLKEELASAHLKLSEANEALRICRRNHTQKDSRTSRDVSILFNAPSDEEIVLRLTYNVGKASWIPSYDVRVSESNGSQAMQLSYFGVVKQNTGEDWANAQLNLSTATPSIGGTPPAPPTKIVQFRKSALKKVNQEKMLNLSNMQSNMAQRQNLERRMAPRAPMPRVPQRRLSNDANELEYSDDEELDEGETVTQASVSETAGGSSTFRIERKTTINSDNKDHKVCISVIELSPQFRYFATPALEAKAYLQVRAINNSVYSLLASNKVAVFFDGSFVCNTDLKNIQPGEAFSVFLGSDVTVKVEHKLLKKTSNEGKEGSLMAKKVDSREDYEYLTLLHNTKNRDIEITVVQLLPRSDDEKIVVDLVSPSPSLLKDSGSATGAGQLKQDSVMRNKITNNVVFSKKLKPQEKLEIPFAYSIQWPFDQNIEVQ